MEGGAGASSGAAAAMATKAEVCSALGLSTADYDALSGETSGKSVLAGAGTLLQDHAALAAALEALKAATKLDKLSFENQFAVLEKRVVTSEARLEAKTTLCEQLQVELKTTEAALAKERAGSQAAQAASSTLEGTQRDLASKLETLQDEQRRALEQLANLKAENDRVTGENKTLFDTKLQLTSDASKLRNDLEEVKGQSTAQQLREKRLEGEKAMLQERVEALMGEVKTKASALIAVHKEKGQEAFDLQQSVERLTEELKNASDTREQFRSRLEESQSKLRQLQEQQKAQSDAWAEEREQHRQMLASKTKLADLCKSGMEDAKSRADELSRAVSELTKLRNQAVSEGTAHEEKAVAMVQEKESTIEQLEKENTRLQKELLAANDFMANAGKGKQSNPTELLSPSAAAASQALEGGLSLTQMYSKLVETTEALHSSQADVRRLETYLGQILKDIETKAPVFQQQRMELQRAQKANMQLTVSIEEAHKTCAQLEEVASTTGRRSAQLERENRQLRAEIDDLSRQVQVLLRENEEARGRVVSMDAAPTAPATGAGSAQQVIDENLVTVKSIAAMQKQNSELRQLVRELSAQQESEEQQRQKTMEAEHIAQMKEALSELEDMRAARGRQEQHVQAIIRQRDMFNTLYKRLCDEVGKDPQATTAVVMGTPKPKSANGSPAAAPPTNRTSSSLKSVESSSTIASQQQKTLLEELQRSFESYREEQAVNNKMISEELEKTREDSYKFRLQADKLSTQNEYVTERLQELKRSLASVETERDRLRTKNAEFGATVVAHQKQIRDLESVVSTSKEAVSQLEVSCKNAKAEKGLLEQNEKRLAQEVKTLLHERSSQNTQVTNLLQIQNEMKRAESELQSRLTSQVDALTKECEVLRKRLEKEEARSRAASSHHQKELQGLRGEMEAERKVHQKTREDLVAANCKTESLTKELDSSGERLKASEQRLNLMLATTSTTGAGAEGSSSDRDSLTAAMGEIQTLQEKLKAANEHSAHFKAIATATENTLKDLNANHEKFKTIFEAEQQKATQQVAALRDRLVSLEEETNSKTARIADLERQLTKAASDGASKVAELETKLAEAAKNESMARHNEGIAQEDFRKQAALAAENADKFERQVTLHAADLENLKRVKTELETLQKQVVEARTAAESATEALKASEASWTEQKRTLEQEIEKQASRCQDVEKQNALLHSHVESVSSELVALKRSSLPAVPEGAARPLTEASDQELWEVVRYHRNQAQIAETEVEQAKLENARLQQNVEHVTRQLEQTRRLLTEEQERTQVTVRTATEHSELLAKVEKLHLLQESNQLLRDEKERCEAKIVELDTKLTHIQNDILPVKEDNRKLKSKNETIAAENKSLDNQVKRWTNRVLKLQDQYQKIDPEEYNKVMAENKTLVTARDAFQKEVLALREEAKASSAAKAAAEASLQAKAKETTELKGMNVKLRALGKKLQGERKAARKDHETAAKELAALKQSATANAEVTALTAEREQLRAEVVKKDSDFKKLKELVAKAKKTILEKNTELSSLKAAQKISNTQLLAAKKKIEEMAKTAAADRASSEDLRKKTLLLSQQLNKLRQQLAGKGPAAASAAAGKAKAKTPVKPTPITVSKAAPAAKAPAPAKAGKAQAAAVKITPPGALPSAKPVTLRPVPAMPAAVQFPPATSRKRTREEDKPHAAAEAAVPQPLAPNKRARQATAPTPAAPAAPAAAPVPTPEPAAEAGVDVEAMDGTPDVAVPPPAEAEAVAVDSTVDEPMLAEETMVGEEEAPQAPPPAQAVVTPAAEVAPVLAAPVPEAVTVEETAELVAAAEPTVETVPEETAPPAAAEVPVAVPDVEPSVPPAAAAAAPATVAASAPAAVPQRARRRPESLSFTRPEMSQAAFELEAVEGVPSTPVLPSSDLSFSTGMVSVPSSRAPHPLSNEVPEAMVSGSNSPAAAVPVDTSFDEPEAPTDEAEAESSEAAVGDDVPATDSDAAAVPSGEDDGASAVPSTEGSLDPTAAAFEPTLDEAGPGEDELPTMEEAGDDAMDELVEGDEGMGDPEEEVALEEEAGTPGIGVDVDLVDDELEADGEAEAEVEAEVDAEAEGDTGGMGEDAPAGMTGADPDGDELLLEEMASPAKADALASEPTDAADSEGRTGEKRKATEQPAKAAAKFSKIEFSPTASGAAAATPAEGGAGAAAGTAGAATTGAAAAAAANKGKGRWRRTGARGKKRRGGGGGARGGRGGSARGGASSA